jgi:hypothetical protein
LAGAKRRGLPLGSALTDSRRVSRLGSWRQTLATKPSSATGTRVTWCVESTVGGKSFHVNESNDSDHAEPGPCR